MNEKNFVFDLRPNKLLLDPSFEGYKLSLEKIPLYRKELASGIHIVHPNDNQFSYYHAKKFSLHNHLYVNIKKSDGVYFVDEHCKVFKIIFSTMDCEILVEEVFDFFNLCTKKSGNYNVSIVFPSSDIAVIGTGEGTLYLVEINEIEGKEHWEPCLPNALIDEKKPCLLMNSQMQVENGDNFLHVLALEIEEKSPLNKNLEKNGLFETILKWRIFFQTQYQTWIEKSLKKFSVDGNVDHIDFENNCKGLYIVCDKNPKPLGDVKNLTSAAEDNPERTFNSGFEKNYFWTQTDKEITLWFPVNETVRKEDIQISISDLTLEIKIKNEHFISGEFFQRIDKGLSVWCIEKNKLEVQLMKFESGLMWRTLLVNDNKGEEIIDPSIVNEVHKNLAHLCSENNENKLPPFNTQQLEECDIPNSDSLLLVRLDGSSNEITHKVNLSNSQWLFNVNHNPDQPSAMCCRHDVDACVWQFKQYNTNERSWPCEHLGTFNAFGYVQASKTLKKFTTCAPNLSYAAICEASRHIYIYRQPSVLSSELKNRNTGKKVKTIAKQQLINLETSDQILGIHATNNILYTLLERSICISIVNE